MRDARYWPICVLYCWMTLLTGSPNNALGLLNRYAVSRYLRYTSHASKANSAFHPSLVGKWVLALAGKAKAGMVYSVSGWTRGVQVKLLDHHHPRILSRRKSWNKTPGPLDPLRTRAVAERLRGVFTTRRYTNNLHLYMSTVLSIWHCSLFISKWRAF